MNKPQQPRRHHLPELPRTAWVQPLPEQMAVAYDAEGDLTVIVIDDHGNMWSGAWVPKTEGISTGGFAFQWSRLPKLPMIDVERRRLP